MKEVHSSGIFSRKHRCATRKIKARRVFSWRRGCCHYLPNKRGLNILGWIYDKRCNKEAVDQAHRPHSKLCFMHAFFLSTKYISIIHMFHTVSPPHNHGESTLEINSFKFLKLWLLPEARFVVSKFVRIQHL